VNAGSLIAVVSQPILPGRAPVLLGAEPGTDLETLGFPFHLNLNITQT
jgi:hypothetical protein